MDEEINIGVGADTRAVTQLLNAVELLNKTITSLTAKLNAAGTASVKAAGEMSALKAAISNVNSAFQTTHKTNREVARTLHEVGTIFSKNNKNVKDFARGYRALDAALKSNRGIAKSSDDLKKLGSDIATGSNRISNAQKHALRLDYGLRNVKSVSQAWQKLGQNTRFVGRSLATSVALPVALGAKLATDEYLRLDKEITRIAKVYGDLPDDFDKDSEKIKDSIKGISHAFGQTRSITAAVFSDLAAQGYSLKESFDTSSKQGAEAIKKNIESVLKTEVKGSLDAFAAEVSRASLLGDIDLGIAQDQFTALFAIFGQDSAVAAAGFSELGDQIGYTGDILNQFNAIENATKIQMREIASAFPEVALSAKQFNLSAAQTVGIMASMRKAGLEADESATALKFSFARLQNPTEKTKDLLKELAAEGVHVNRFMKDAETGALKARPGIAVLADIGKAVEKLGGVGSQKAAELMSELFGNRQVNRMATAIVEVNEGYEEINRNIDRLVSGEMQVSELTNEFAKAMAASGEFKFLNQGAEGFLSLVKSAENGSEEAQRILANLRKNANRELEKIFQSDSFKIAQLKADIKGLASDFGATLFPVLHEGMQLLRSFLETFNNMGTGTKTILTGMLVAFALIGPAMMAASVLIESFASVTSFASSGLLKLTRGVKTVSAAHVAAMGGFDAFNAVLGREGKELIAVGDIFRVVKKANDDFSDEQVEGAVKTNIYTAAIERQTASLRELTAALGAAMAMPTPGSAMASAAPLDVDDLKTRGRNGIPLNKSEQDRLNELFDLEKNSGKNDKQAINDARKKLDDERKAPFRRQARSRLGMHPTKFLTGAQLAKSNKLADKLFEDENLKRKAAKEIFGDDWAKKIGLKQNNKMLMNKIRAMRKAAASLPVKPDLYDKDLGPSLSSVIKPKGFRAAFRSQRMALPSMKTGMQGVAAAPVLATKKATDATKKFGKSLAPISRGKGALSSLATGFGKVAASITKPWKLLSKFGNLLKFGLTKTIWGAVIVGAIAGIITIIKSLQKHWGTFYRAMEPGWKELKKAIKPVWESIKKMLAPFKRLQGLAGDGSATGKMAKFWTNVGEAIGFVFRWIAKFINFVKPAIDVIVKMFATMFHAIVDVIMMVVSFISGDWRSGLKYLASAVINAASISIKAFEILADTALTILGKLVQGVIHGAGTILDWLGFDGMGEKLRDAGRAIDQWRKGITNKDWTGALKGTLEKALGIDELKNSEVKPQIKPEVKKPPAGSSNKLGETIGDDIEEGINDAIELDPSEWLNRLKSALDDVMDDLVESALDDFDKMAEGRIDSYDKQIEAINELNKADELYYSELEYRRRREQLLRRKSIDDENYRRNRALAIYEGRIDDARMLDREQVRNTSDFNDEVGELDEDRRRELVQNERDLATEKLEAQKEGEQARLDSLRETLEKELEALQEYTPKTVEELQNRINLISEAMVNAGATWSQAGAHAGSLWAEAVINATRAAYEDAHWNPPAAAGGTGSAPSAPTVTAAPNTNVSAPTSPTSGGTTSGSSITLGATASGTRTFSGTAQIKELQTFLTNMGYSPGPIDGILGPKTKAAVAEYNGEPWIVSPQVFLDKGYNYTSRGLELAMSGTTDANQFSRWANFTRMVGATIPAIHGSGYYHSGGLVHGSPKSDEVDARLQKGEFVVQRSAVASVGRRVLEAINQGRIGPMLAQMIGSFDPGREAGASMKNLARHIPMAKMAKGGVVPFDNFPALLHKREMVLPKGIADKLTDKGHGDCVHISVDTFIGQREWFDRMMKDYGVHVEPKNSRGAGNEVRTISSYKRG